MVSVSGMKTNGLKDSAITFISKLKFWVQKPPDIPRRWESCITRRPNYDFIRVIKYFSFGKSFVSGPMFFGVVLKDLCSRFIPCSERVLINVATLSCEA